MNLVSATVYALEIPFVAAFRHRLAERRTSHSVVVKLQTEGGAAGFGEGLPRPYVTGETLASSVDHILHVLLPSVLGLRLEDLDPHDLPGSVAALLPCVPAPAGACWNAARCAVELAVVDCALRALGASMGDVLAPRRTTVVYTGVLSAGPPDDVEKGARRMQAAGMRHVKFKVSGASDADLVRRVRDILGPAVSLRLDANGAFTPDAAVRFLAAVEPCGIDAIEQPVPRGDPAAMAAVRAGTVVPVMADESLRTREDAAALIAHGACDLFNLRLSKCGGLHATLAMAAMARQAGVGIQLGCQVGETAVLSAAGRHLAAHLDDLRYVEGSYGAHLLAEDIAVEDLRFGRGGVAPLLHGPGWGITVREDLLARYAVRTEAVPAGGRT